MDLKQCSCPFSPTPYSFHFLNFEIVIIYIRKQTNKQTVHLSQAVLNHMVTAAVCIIKILPFHENHKIICIFLLLENVLSLGFISKIKAYVLDQSAINTK